MVDKRDLNLQLCSDDPIFVGGVPIYPIPISEIAKIGYMRFNACLLYTSDAADEL